MRLISSKTLLNFFANTFLYIQLPHTQMKETKNKIKLCNVEIPIAILVPFCWLLPALYTSYVICFYSCFRFSRRSCQSNASKEKQGFFYRSSSNKSFDVYKKLKEVISVLWFAPLCLFSRSAERSELLIESEARSIHASRRKWVAKRNSSWTRLKLVSTCESVLPRLKIV